MSGWRHPDVSLSCGAAPTLPLGIAGMLEALILGVDAAQETGRVYTMTPGSENDFRVA